MKSKLTKNSNFGVAQATTENGSGHANETNRKNSEKGFSNRI